MQARAQDGATKPHNKAPALRQNPFMNDKFLSSAIEQGNGKFGRWEHVRKLFEACLKKTTQCLTTAAFYRLAV